MFSAVRKNLEAATDHACSIASFDRRARCAGSRRTAASTVDDKGAPIRLVGVCSDVTDRVQTDAARVALVVEQTARREAEQAGARTQQILTAIADIFVVCRSDWTVAFASQAGARMLGGEPEQILGTSLWATPAEIVGSTLERGLRRAVQNQAVTTFEDRNATRTSGSR